MSSNLSHPETAAEEQDLLLVTLALTEACKSRCWPDVNVLLERRSTILEAILSRPEPVSEGVLRCAEIGNEVVIELAQQRSEITTELRKLALCKRALKSYKLAAAIP